MYYYFVRIMKTEINNIETIITSTPTPVVPVMTPVVPVNHGEKLEKFNGNDFKRWQQKMIFYLTTLNLARFTHEKAQSLNEGETDRQVVAAVHAWKHGEFLWQNYILNGLDNTLYNVYSVKTLQKNYGNLYIINIRQWMPVQRNLLAAVFWTLK